MKKKHGYSLALTLVILLIGGAFAVGTSVFQSSDTSSTTQAAAENVKTGHNVWVSIDRGPNAPEEYEDEKFVVHNVLMEGEEAIETQIGDAGTSVTWDQIAVGNGTAPTTSSTSLASEYDGTFGCGLSPVSATYDDVGDGNWNQTATFTATGDDCDVNTTAQKSGTAASAIDYFAGASFNTRTLFSGDDIQVEWENTIS